MNLTACALTAALALTLCAGDFHAPSTTPPPLQGTAAVSGRLTGAEKQPLQNIEMRVVPKKGSPSDAPGRGGQAFTDKDGGYRIAGLAPGDYIVIASAYTLNLETHISERRSPATTVRPDGTRIGYVTTAYHGANSSAPLAVQLETSERAGVDFQLDQRPVFEVSGSIGTIPPRTTGPDTVSILLVAPDAEALTFGRQAGIVDGKFKFTDVPAGRYRVTLTRAPRMTEVELVIVDRNPEFLTLVLRRRPVPDR